VNRELFKKINDIIGGPHGIDLDKFNMTIWEGVESCGTTRCIAGWAINLTTGEPLFNGRGKFSGATERLAESMGLAGVDLEEMGARLLGLGLADRGIFYSDEFTAAEFVRLAAEGDEEGARRLWGRD